MSHDESLPLEHATTRQQIAARSRDDAELLSGALARDNAAIGELMRRYGPALQAKLVGFAGEQTDEIVADTFLSLPSALRQYHDDGRLERWLFRLAFNLARTRRRSVRRRAEVEVPLTAPGRRDPSAILHLEEAQWMERAGQVLSDAEREVWFLSVVGHTRSEIAELLALQESAVGVRLHRARTRLAQFRDA
jgi:RNA polymerase sigma factor (sigma-70 family)